ncbi:hypothetical protein [Salana multivorans]
MLDELVRRLRAAGCVFAEEEAEILVERAAGDPGLLEELTAARERGAPLEPLVGWVGFAGLRLVVAPGVFVPRQRTLRLLDRALLELRALLEPPTRPGGRSRAPVFVEVFAGVAPLVAGVHAALPAVQVLACEQDPVALRCAAENLGSDGTVCRSDVLAGLPERCRGVVDVVAAVPPYVPTGEIGLLPREAREHEPLVALDGGADGLRWVRALIDQSLRWIAPGGLLLVELLRAPARGRDGPRGRTRVASRAGRRARRSGGPAHPRPRPARPELDRPQDLDLPQHIGRIRLALVDSSKLGAPGDEPVRVPLSHPGTKEGMGSSSVLLVRRLRDRRSSAGCSIVWETDFTD